MLRLPLFCLVPTLLAAVPLVSAAQAPVDSVVRTTTVTTVTTTTVTKPAAPGSKPTAVTSSSSTTTTATAPTTSATPTPVPPATPATATRQPGPGDLVGARPAATAKPAATATAKPGATAKPKAVPVTSASRTTAAPARPAQTAPRTAASASDPTLARLLQTNVDLSKVRADELPNLYERFLETTRSERRQWTSAQWESASAALARLNQRYQQLRADISLEDKLNIRTLQGEFRTLEAAKQVSKRL